MFAGGQARTREAQRGFAELELETEMVQLFLGLKLSDFNLKPSALEVSLASAHGCRNDNCLEQISSPLNPQWQNPVGDNFRGQANVRIDTSSIVNVSCTVWLLIVV